MPGEDSYVPGWKKDYDKEATMEQCYHMPARPFIIIYSLPPTCITIFFKNNTPFQLFAIKRKQIKTVVVFYSLKIESSNFFQHLKENTRKILTTSPTYSSQYLNITIFANDCKWKQGGTMSKQCD